MASSKDGKGEEGTSSPKQKEEEEEEGGISLKELARELPSAGEQQVGGGGGDEYERREPTEADMERYRAYVGQKWTGVCKWFNVSKGFGFIVPDAEEAKEHQDDVFVHQSSLQMPGFRSLDEGEGVEFTVRLGRRGLEAAEVGGIGGAPIRGHRIHPLGRRKEKEIRCFNCGQYGHHKASKCRRMPANVKACYVCQSTEHLAMDCPRKGSLQQQQQKGPPRGGAGGGARGGLRGTTGGPSSSGGGRH